MKPLARSDQLVIEDLGDELLVYDLKSDRAHSLSAAAARVWQRCDGKTDLALLSAAVNLDSDTVARALEELGACELLDDGATLGTGTTRREMTIKLAKVGATAAAVPLIWSIAAPMAEAAATVTPAFCTSNGTSHGCGIDCMNRHCCCCCQSIPTPPALCGTGSGASMCCLPTAQCGPIFGGNCADTAACP